MSKLGNKILNMQGQLEQQGILLSRIAKKHNFNPKQVDTIGNEYNNCFYDLDAQQNCNKYIWWRESENGEQDARLTDELPSYLVEYMLYMRGSLVGYFNGGILYILPYVNSGELNVYGMPTSISPITFNGKTSATGDEAKQKSLNVNVFGKNAEAKACILYDRLPAWSQSSSPMCRAVLNKTLVDYQADLLGRIKNNLKNLDKKVVFYVDTDTQKHQMMLDLQDAYGTDDPFIVVVKGSNIDNNKETTLQPDISNETQSLFETWQSINSIRCMISGIANGGAFEKKERKIVGELQGDAEQTDLVLDAGLRMRRLFLQQLKETYPEYAEILNKIHVDINSSNKNIQNEDMDEINENQEGVSDVEYT